MANMVLGFEINDIAQLDSIIKNLKAIAGVRDVYRIHK